MANVEKISIALPSEMLETIRDAVEAGDYATTSEVIRTAVRRWETERMMDRVIKRDGLEALKTKIRKADESIDRGEGIPADVVFDRLIKKYRAMADQQRSAQQKRVRGGRKAR
ncbi:MAG: ribbon-helix-helix domain-containing protein [Rhizomicrobium sp.]